jgi:hypothetical protein
MPEASTQHRIEHSGGFVRATTASSFWTFPEAAAAAEKTTIPSLYNVLEFGTLLLLPESSEVSTGIDHTVNKKTIPSRHIIQNNVLETGTLRLFPESSD